MIKPIQFFKEFEKTMSAVTFAEHGEYHTARQIMNSQAKENKKILLGIDEPEIDPKTVRYSLRLCQRMEGELEIIHVSSIGDRSSKAGIQTKEKFLEKDIGKMYEKIMLRKGISYRSIWSDKSIVEEIIDYISTKRNIIGVIIKSTDLFSRSPSQKKGKLKDISTLLEKIHCPVISYN